jgi:NAD(P)-dependent dehydrogenase (short-subunit alcohol dehydrogenase family)
MYTFQTIGIKMAELIKMAEHVALVTGAGRGRGWVMAPALLRAGQRYLLLLKPRTILEALGIRRCLNDAGARAVASNVFSVAQPASH